MTTTSTLTRLRRANPVAEALAVDAPELFAQIASLPGDPRLADRPIRRRGRLVVAVLAMVVLAAIASTAYAISDWVGAPPVRPKVTEFEYRQAQRLLTLPPGYTWPVLHIPANSVTSPGAGGGRAVGIAQHAWECYWVHAIKTGDVAAQRRAHTELESILRRNTIVAPANTSENWSPPNPPKAPFQSFADDGGYQHIRATYAAAAAGHPAQLIQSCRVNGPG